MHPTNTPYGADSGYNTPLQGLITGGDTYEDQGRWGGLNPEAAMLAANPPFEVDKAPITADVRTDVSQAAGLELSA